MGSKTLKIALAGNPNSGKTSIFNALTGSRQKVGNYPGVTVEKRTGHASYRGYDIEFIDLPGTYSLTAYSTDEKVARDYILDYRPDVIINVVDSGNLERNLYLTTQLLELECDMVIALNMWDEAQKMGVRIDTGKLEQLLGAPVVSTVGHRCTGIDQLLKSAVDLHEDKAYLHRHAPVTYGSHVEDLVVDLTSNIDKCKSCGICPSKRWLAVKLLEGDLTTESKFITDPGELQMLQKSIRKKVRHIHKATGEDPEVILTDGRYGYITGILREVMTTEIGDRMKHSRQIDALLTHKLMGYPIFLLLIWLIFQATYVIGAYPQDWIETGVGMLGGWLGGILPAGWFSSLIVDGIVAGCGSVLVFLPNIMILFMGIAALEDSGYMSRAAFLMDKLMHALGLHGKSFIPMIMGFGCSVPAIMATRTLESERDRKMTILLIPLISCSAKLPVYVLFAGAFFSKQAGNVIFSVYLLGIAVAIGVAQILRRTLFRQEVAPFAMELPTYRVPTVKSVVMHMWERASIYLRKIGGVILIASMVIWALGYFPRLSPDVLEVNTSSPDQVEILNQAQYRQEQLTYSMIGRIGQAISPVIEPLGFDWRLGVSILTGFAAKEIVVSTLGVLYQINDEVDGESVTLAEELKQPEHSISPLTAYAFMVFVLLYTPCLGTVIAIRREAGNRMMVFSVLYQLALAWLFAFIVYQGGLIIGLN